MLHLGGPNRTGGTRRGLPPQQFGDAAIQELVQPEPEGAGGTTNDLREVAIALLSRRGQQDRLESLPWADLGRRLEALLQLGFEGRWNRQFEMRSCHAPVFSHHVLKLKCIVMIITGHWYQRYPKFGGPFFSGQLSCQYLQNLLSPTIGVDRSTGFLLGTTLFFKLRRI